MFSADLVVVDVVVDVVGVVVVVGCWLLVVGCCTRLASGNRLGGSWVGLGES